MKEQCLRKLSLIGLIWVALIGMGCSSNKVDKKKISNKGIAFEFLSKSEYYVLENSARDYGVSSDVVCMDSVSMVFPISLPGQDVSALHDTLMVYAFDTLTTDVHRALDYFLEQRSDFFGYETKSCSATSSCIEYNGYRLLYGSIAACSTEVLTYRLSRSLFFPGAAHGMYGDNYINYVIPENKVLLIADLFTVAGIKKLPTLIRERAIEQKEEIGETEIENLPAKNNFYISMDGRIVFVYQPYEVASYAQGIIKISFYLYELKPYMTPYAIRLLHLEEFED